MIDGFHLLRPEALWLLALCPFLGLALWYRRAQQGDWTRVIAPELLKHLIPIQTGRVNPPGVWIPVILFALIVLASSGPSVNRVELPVIKRADAMVIVLDLSASMLAADVQPTRIQRAKQKILDLLDRRKEGVTGLVVFAGDAHIVTPLTDDTRTIANLMPALSPNIMPIQGANATSGIELGKELLMAAGARDGQILLITDGLPNFNVSRAKEALDTSGASLAVLAIGTVAGAPVPLPNGGFLKDDRGEIVIPRLDPAKLSGFASELGGAYSEITLDESDIESLTAKNILMTGGDLDLNRQTDAWQDQGFWIAAFVALILLPGFRKGVFAFLSFALLCHSEPPMASGWDDLWATPDQQGAQLLAEGDASSAAGQFENPNWRGIAEFEAGQYEEAARSFASNQNPDSLFNQGNALALRGDLQGALAAYEESLRLKPNAEDAIKNRDFIRSLLNEQEESNQKKQEGEDQSHADEENQPNSDASGEGENQSKSSDNQDGEPSDTSEQNNSSENQNEQESANQQKSEDQPIDNGQPIESERLQAATQEQMAKFDEALEEQQALEQWLRRVPDDPGGLLRRKFRYQTMQRLREGEEIDESIRW